MRSAGTVSLMALALLASGCANKDETAWEDVRPVRSVVAGAGSGSVGATYSGELQARYESKLGFQASGRVVSRLVEVGSTVRRGQPLMRLDPAQETLHVVAATADVEAARSRVAQNRVDLQRVEQLLGRQFASAAEVDQQRLALAQAESQLKAALAQQEIKQNQRAYTELRADRDGVVTTINAEAGQVVSAGQHVLTVAGDGERDVVVSVAESRVDELRRAKALQVSFWTQPGRYYPAVLREMAPDTDSVSRTYSARITVQGAEGALRLGMTASVHVPDVEGAAAMRLPLTAIYSKDGNNLVWVIDARTSQVAARPVTLGSMQGDSVAIASGLSGGETVVTAGVHLLHAGQKVKPAATRVADRGAQS